MAKNRRRKRQRRATKRGKKSKLDNTRPSVGAAYAEIQSPFAGMTKEEHREVLAEIAQASSTLFDDSLASIEASLKRVDSRGLVATLAANTLFTGVTDKGVNRTEPANGFGQAQVELLHAMSLRLVENELGTFPAVPDAVQEVADALLDASRSFSFTRIDVSDDGRPDDLVMLQEYMRQNTQNVRNWGFFRQVTRDVRELYTPLSEATEPSLGFRITDALDLFEHLIDQSQSRNNSRFRALAEARRAKSTKDMVSRFLKAKGSDDSAQEIVAAAKERGARSKRDVLYMMKCWDDLTSEDVFTFEVSQVAEALSLPEKRLRRVVRQFGHRYGELAEENLEHFFLDNPVWQKPIAIVDENRFFCPMPQVFFSFAMRAIDKLVSPIDEVALSERRSEFLEDRVFALVNRALPGARLFQNLRWPHEDKTYETDLVAVVDSVVLIIEAKSHRISDAALRGAPERLRKHIKETVLDPSQQSSRLASRLAEIRGNPDTEDPLKDILELEPAQMGEIVRVSVTLEMFAALQTSMLQLRDAGLVPDDFVPCPTMNLTSFESVLEILSHPVPLLHYFVARAELEASARIVGDEIDYLSLYLATHFDLNFGDGEQKQRAVISDMSAPLDRYFMSRDEGVDLQKPAPNVSRLFSGILRMVEDRMPARWIEIGMLLSRPSPKRQREFEKRLGHLKKRVRRARDPGSIDNILIYTPPQGDEYALAFVVVTEKTVHRRREFADTAIDLALASDHVNTCTVVAINIDDDAPYCLIMEADDREPAA